MVFLLSFFIATFSRSTVGNLPILVFYSQDSRLSEVIFELHLKIDCLRCRLD